MSRGRAGRGAGPQPRGAELSDLQCAGAEPGWLQCLCPPYTEPLTLASAASHEGTSHAYSSDQPKPEAAATRATKCRFQGEALSEQWGLIRCKGPGASGLLLK